MFVYLAGPLFSEAERDFNTKLRFTIEKYASVYLPQKDGRLLQELLKEGLTIEEATKEVVEKDILAIRTCDLVIAVLDGRTVEDGTSFEIGFAFALGKKCIGFQTDSRREISCINNPMIEVACEAIFHDLKDIVPFLKDFSPTSL